jgi:hypothetical protein
MLIWSMVLFALGILALLDSQFNYGYLFRTANSAVFMLVALGILIRTRMLEKMGIKERLLLNNDELRARMLKIKDQQKNPQAQPVTPAQQPREEIAADI